MPWKSCARCNRRFYRRNFRPLLRCHGRYFCSRVCSDTGRQFPDRSGPAGSTWKGGIPRRICGYCATVFFAYNKTSTTPRRYCSWQCSNAANRRLTTPLQGRVRYERELMVLLEKDGFCCLRSAGSRGPVDLYAFNTTAIRAIQVKSTKAFNRPGNNTMFATAITDLFKVQGPSCMTRELWVRELRGPWRFVPIPLGLEDRTAARQFLQKVEWQIYKPVEGGDLERAVA